MLSLHLLVGGAVIREFSIVVVVPFIVNHQLLWWRLPSLTNLTLRRQSKCNMLPSHKLVYNKKKHHTSIAYHCLLLPIAWLELHCQSILAIVN